MLGLPRFQTFQQNIENIIRPSLTCRANFPTFQITNVTEAYFLILNCFYFANTSEVMYNTTVNRHNSGIADTSRHLQKYSLQADWSAP